MDKYLKIMLALLGVLGSGALMAQKTPGTAAWPRNYQPKTVAILPVGYIGEGSDRKLSEMRYRLQTEAHNYLSKHARELTIIDPSEVNARLLKNGVDESTYRKYTNAELAQLLGVDYVIAATVTQEQGNVTSSSNTTVNESWGSTRRGRRDQNLQRKGQNNTVTSENLDIKTTVDLAVFNVDGERVFGQSRKSMLSTIDAHKNTLHYLLKRTPVYGR